MKKITAMIVAGFIATIATADLTDFTWEAGTGVTSGQYIYTFLNVDDTADIWDYISSDEIDITDLALFTEIDSQSVTVSSFGPVSGQWFSSNITGDSSWVDYYVFAVATDSSTWSEISVGDTITIFSTEGTLSELWPDGQAVASLTQSFDPGSGTTITVIPEPATIGLFGLGALSVWFIRRSKKVQREEA
jgi:hypothetical protein